jgi:hypothetical protein
LPAGAIVNHGQPNLKLTLAVVIAGGGSKHFDAATLFGVLAGPNAKAETAKLKHQYGAKRFREFVSVFTFAIDDSLAVVTHAKIPLPTTPAPNPADGKALSAALYQAGTTPSGKWDVGYMLEGLISHPVHHVVMSHIDESFTPETNASFHIILTTAMQDLKTAYQF